ncbi:YncE family protein [Bacteroides congonensis]
MRKLYLIPLLLFLLFFSACREDEQIFLSDSVQVTLPLVGTRIKGFYQLNEGNMGTNGASLDYFDYTTGYYTRDIFSERNPDIVKELGDVGNDIQVYGQKVYAIINVSNLVVVFDVRTARKLKEIEIPNCRYLAFHDGKAYVSSYAGPVQIAPNAEKGLVAEIDTVTLKLTRKVTVGYQPEEMIVHEGKLYVANSGGYRAPNYDRTVSVVDLETFVEKKKIDVAINLYRMAIDKRGDIYVSSRGDYKNTSPNLYVIDSRTDEVKQCLDIPVGGMCMSGDSLYYYSVAYSMSSGGNRVTYGILDTRTKKEITDRIITDGTDKEIMIPYGLAINPETKEILMSDAQNYVVTGFVYCFSPEGRLRWKTQGGNIPGHFAFVTEGLVK